jgi:SAM-dependent methyltransferase
MDGYDRTLVTGRYAEVAEEYAATYGDDATLVPVNRRVLDEVARRAAGRGPVVDLGCGPAQAARHLRAAGCAAVGLDPTEAMLAQARSADPGLPLAAAEAGALPLRPGSCAAVVAFFVLHHVRRPDLGRTLAEVRRVLAGGGTFALATHEGTGTFVAEGTPIVGTLYAEDELVGALAAAGLRVDVVDGRTNLPHERAGRRLYLVATATA